MKKKVATTFVMLLAACPLDSVSASGFRIAEQSVNAMALSGAYMAHTPDADASYFNPANMAWADSRGLMEADLLFTHQSSLRFTDRQSESNSLKTEDESGFFPAVFAVSPDYRHLRAGCSLTDPARYSRRWVSDDGSFDRVEELSFRATEFSTVGSYRISQYFSAAGGGRVLYSQGEMRSLHSDSLSGAGSSSDNELEGDGVSFGYLLAASARPYEHMMWALSYRSRVDLDFEGSGVLRHGTGTLAASSAVDGSFSAHLPAVLALAASYTFFDDWTLEFVFERVFWSEFDQLNVNYSPGVNSPEGMGASEDESLGWEDTKNFRLGIRYDLDPRFSLMAGIATEQSPVPDGSFGLGMADSDTTSYSMGFRYRFNREMDCGVAYQYKTMDERLVSDSLADGRVTGGSGHRFALSASYAF